MNSLLHFISFLFFLALSGNAMAGYDLHITKASERSESSKRSISEGQWKAIVAADGELQMDTTVTATNPKTHEIIQVTNPLMASWTDPESSKKYYFYYSRGKITVKNPSEKAIKKMKALASKIGAQVQGDEGEKY